MEYIMGLIMKGKPVVRTTEVTLPDSWEQLTIEEKFNEIIELEKKLYLGKIENLFKAIGPRSLSAKHFNFTGRAQNLIFDN
jgi:hypothetical protein